MDVVITQSLIDVTLTVDHNVTWRHRYGFVAVQL